MSWHNPVNSRSQQVASSSTSTDMHLQGTVSTQHSTVDMIRAPSAHLIGVRNGGVPGAGVVSVMFRSLGIQSTEAHASHGAVEIDYLIWDMPVEYLLLI